jgi:hypothetical protein
MVRPKKRPEKPSDRIRKTVKVQDKPLIFAGRGYNISAFERIRKRMGKSVGEFYAVPRDPPSSSKLPIFDISHVIY